MPIREPLLFFIFVVPPLWFAIGGLIARIGGWRELASYYRVNPGAGGVRFPLSSISLRTGLLPAKYRHTVTVALWADGFGLSAPFSAMHPPLLIPWSAIRECREGGFLRRYVEVALQRPDTRIRVYGRARGAVHQKWLSARSAPAPLTRRGSRVS
jgi:hypothetical protein